MSFINKIIIILLLTACTKKGADLFPSTQLGAHAGAGLHISSSVYHDNSLEAVNYALSFTEIQWIEVDIQLSKDDTWWLFHDVELDTESSGSGKIQLLSDDVLNGLKYKSLNHEKIVRLFDLPTSFSGKKLLLDLRETDGSESGLIDSTRLIQSLTLMKNHFQTVELNLITSTGRFINTIKSLGITVFLNAENTNGFWMHTGSTVADGAVFRNAVIDEQGILQLKEQNKRTIIYDIRSPKGIRKAFKKQPDLVLTDDILSGIIEKYK